VCGSVKALNKKSCRIISNGRRLHNWRARCLGPVRVGTFLLIFVQFGRGQRELLSIYDRRLTIRTLPPTAHARAPGPEPCRLDAECRRVLVVAGDRAGALPASGSEGLRDRAAVQSPVGDVPGGTQNPLHPVPVARTGPTVLGPRSSLSVPGRAEVAPHRPYDALGVRVHLLRPKEQQ